MTRNKNFTIPGAAHLAIRAKTIITLAGENPARGKDLLAPVKLLDNGQIIARNGRITEISTNKTAPSDCKIVDLGDSCIFPPLTNAHTHLQLSWLSGRVAWGNGFAAWLKNMVPQLLQGAAELINPAARNLFASSIRQAALSLARSGTLHIGDVGGSIAGALPEVCEATRQAGIESSFFCEWFGFDIPADISIWPPRCRQEIAQNDFSENCAPAGHALYSTNPKILRRAHAWCKNHNRIFSIHLAESDEETEMLLTGAGQLKQFYENSVLPQDWTAPGMRPYEYAENLGLLDGSTLIVHGVKLSDLEIRALAKSGAALCLCPRSNRNIGVGQAPALKLMESGALLCLGTDGLTSCGDLDVMREAVFLQEHMDMPKQALWRMLTVNGCAALGFSATRAALIPGGPARFSILPACLQ